MKVKLKVDGRTILCYLAQDYCIVNAFRLLGCFIFVSNLDFELRASAFLGGMMKGSEDT